MITNKIQPSLYLSLLIILLSLISIQVISAQSTGDTIVVQVFDYSSTTRDVLIDFPDENLSFEKIIMKYNMRCKGGLVSTGSDRNKGCGEWDYSCNTYIVDSSKIEPVESTHPNYIISNFGEDTFNYTTIPLFDYYQFNQTKIVQNTIIAEEQFEISNGIDIVTEVMDGSQKSGKSQVLYLATELLDAGFTVGKIDGIILEVANEGSQVNFFKLGIKTVDLDQLDANNPVLEDFTNVYDSHYSFEQGENRILFINDFEWDGTSNLLFEWSFTNGESKEIVQLMGAEQLESMCIFSNNNYAIDFSQNGNITIDPSNMTSIDKEVSISFWTYGNQDILPTNTSIIWANATNDSERELNIHLPWSNGNIYFDCGYDSGYDRLEKGSSAVNYKGRWNHWAFTKNANSGIMKIYINGDLFANSTGNSRNMEFLEMILGSDFKNENNYKGKINEFRVWDTSLTNEEIKSWINKPIDNSHPQYDHLVAYYPFGEGNGNVVFDHKNNTSSTGTNMFWSFERGDKLSRGFRTSTIRPQITLLRGSYDTDTEIVTALDSIQRVPSLVQSYSISSNQGTAKHDKIVIDDSILLYGNNDIIVYNGETGDIISSKEVLSEGTIIIDELVYFQRFPFYNEIMSFVTPYGIGLDLGEEGKSWYFDVSDFAPILQGEKGLKMTLGGQNQEEMDLSFLFIVGTPPREVVAFDQLWQGTNRTGAPNIYDLFEDEKFKSISLDLNPNANSFKLKSTITGHGSEGEFQQNGGAVFHSITIDEELINFWNLHKECSENPIYPQGGTWVIDRQGWCPGEPSLVTELDITEEIEPGTTIELDYTISKADKANAQYRYHMAHQLISYGPANHDLDVRISEVLNPTDNILNSRFNPTCTNPTIIIQNTGATTLTSLDIDYWINETGTKATFHWSGSLEFMETEKVILPSGNVFAGVNASKNIFHINLKNPNGVATDDYVYNDKYQTLFMMSDVLPDEFILEIKTNNRPVENNYFITDHNGKIVESNGLAGANTIHRDTIRLEGCYNLVIRDTGNDGLQWWANSQQGTGHAKIRDLDGGIIKTFNPDFGGKLTYGFSSSGVSSTLDKDHWQKNIRISPNPNFGNFVLEGEKLKDLQFELYNIYGEKLATPILQEDEMVQFKVDGLPSGVYFLRISDGLIEYAEKIIVQ